MTYDEAKALHAKVYRLAYGQAWAAARAVDQTGLDAVNNVAHQAASFASSTLLDVVVQKGIEHEHAEAMRPRPKEVQPWR
jgi:hypothetical protein